MAYLASVGRPVTDRAAALHIGHMLSRVALTGTIVRLGEALPVVFFSSAVDFILPVNCRRSTTAVRAASGTAGKMKSTALEKNTTGSASPRRTIVLSLTTASSVILVLKETEAAKADALVGRFWALGQIRAWTWPRRVLDLDAPLT